MNIRQIGVMNIRQIVDYVHDQKRRGEAYGWKLEVVCLSLEDYKDFQASVVSESAVAEAYNLVKDGDKVHETIHGARIIWSGKDLPPHQVWLRFAGAGKKTTESGGEKRTS